MFIVLDIGNTQHTLLTTDVGEEHTSATVFDIVDIDCSTAARLGRGRC